MIDRHWEGIAAYCRPENKVGSCRRGAQQQDPRPPAPRLRPSRRRVPAAQDPHLHAARHLTVSPYPQVPGFTHTTSRRAHVIKRAEGQTMTITITQRYGIGYRGKLGERPWL